MQNPAFLMKNWIPGFSHEPLRNTQVSVWNPSYCAWNPSFGPILGWIWSILDWLWSILDGFWSILGWIKSIFDTECRQPRTRLVGWICQPCSGSTMATTQARSSLQSSSMVRVYRKCCLLCIYMPAVDRSLSDCSRAACTAATCGWDFKRGIDGIDGIDGIEAAVWWSGYGRPDYAGWGQFSMEESWFTIEEFEFLVEEFWFPI